MELRTGTGAGLLIFIASPILARPVPSSQLIFGTGFIATMSGPKVGSALWVAFFDFHVDYFRQYAFWKI
ncbi:MAG: hypothetical protein EBW86_09515 [Rhodobacteraceae bacterium]|nr:hypothetical protein [Paracoccaceae bacterium]